VYLLTAHNTELSILTCNVPGKYLHQLRTELPRSGSAHMVHRYGPVNILNIEQRVKAVDTIYKLILDRAANQVKEILSAAE
ncbi:hypothetical protein MMC14_010266, partial [Varicellaria rhodocarpa]|nr:hypothetical protein [Varicellaria rhodocarpa]